MDTRIHISLEVADLEASIHFYRQLFQREPTKVKPDYANFRMVEPALHLALVHRPDRAPAGESSQHFGVELFSDERLAGWLEAVKEAELDPRIEEQVTCCYAVADKFWVRDPDGHEWEFWVRTEEAEQMREESAEACCAPLTGTDAELAGAEGGAGKGGSCCAPSIVQLGARRA